MSFEDVEDFNPFRGNQYVDKRLEDKSKGIFAKDKYGRPIKDPALSTEEKARILKSIFQDRKVKIDSVLTADQRRKISQSVNGLNKRREVAFRQWESVHKSQIESNSFKGKTSRADSIAVEQPKQPN